MNSAEKMFKLMKPKVGKSLGCSNWLLIDQEMINDFARVTHDWQYIHVNEVRAEKETSFGGTIAHGFLILSLSSRLALEVLPKVEGKTIVINYGFDNVRFLSPVNSGVRVRGHFVIKSLVKSNPNQLRQVYDLSIEIENSDRPALVADWVIMTIFGD